MRETVNDKAVGFILVILNVKLPVYILMIFMFWNIAIYYIYTFITTYL